MFVWWVRCKLPCELNRLNRTSLNFVSNPYLLPRNTGYFSFYGSNPCNGRNHWKSMLTKGCEVPTLSEPNPSSLILAQTAFRNTCETALHDRIYKQFVSNRARGYFRKSWSQLKSLVTTPHQKGLSKLPYAQNPHTLYL